MRRIIEVYDYRDDIGTLVFQVVRFAPKDFRQRRLDEHGRSVWGLSAGWYKLRPLRSDDPGAGRGEWVRIACPADRDQRPKPHARWFDESPRVLYNLPQVKQAVTENQAIYIAEGEKDVDALRKAGVVATCNPGGAGMWRAEFSEVLRGARVTIVADKDEPDPKTGRAPGVEHARSVAGSLQGIAVSVEIVQAAAGKDATDHFGA